MVGTLPKKNKHRGRRSRWKQPHGKKQGNKNTTPAAEMSKRRLLAKRARIDEQLAALEAADGAEPDLQEGPEDEERAVDHGENRIVVKFFWQQLGSPADPDEWKGRDGVISVIRRRMGKGAPSARACERTLLRLVEDENDDLMKKPGGVGATRILSDEEELYIGLLLCEGHSQRSATFIINTERTAQDLPLISKTVVENAEKHLELIRRRRRSTKSGSSDLESAWARGSLAFALQVQLQLRAGAELACRPIVGPTIKLLRANVPEGQLTVMCMPADEWGILGEQINVRWPGLGWYKCKLVAFTDSYKWARDDAAPTYILESTTKQWGVMQYPMRASHVWDRLTAKQRSDVEAAAEAFAAKPPPFVPEQLLIVDQHHRKCRLGKSSTHDCKLPMKDGVWCKHEDGGEYPEWTDRKTVKFAKEARLHFGVMIKRGVDGQLHGHKMKPFEYSDKWVVGVKRIEQEVKAIVDKANRLKATHGAWSLTKGYSKEQLAGLEGGRWEAWYIEKHKKSELLGENWRDAVMEKVGSGDHALICVTELMEHTIQEGVRLFADTPFKDTWMILSDRLASWWEAEAQSYLENHPLGNFKDRQVRAWGDTNSEFWRYHESVPGDRPELMALDFHLFEDLDFSTDQNIINTSSLPVANEAELAEGDLGLGLRYDDGTPKQLSWAMRRTWLHNPTSERIVEDVTRYPLVIDKIVEHKGGVVPDYKMQHAGCSKRKRKVTEESRLYVPSPEVATVAAERRLVLREEASRQNKARVSAI